MPELRIGINPKDAEAGAKRVQAALNRVSGSARTTVGATKKVENGFEQLKRGSFTLQRALGALGVTIGALALLKLAKDAVLLAARYETLGVVMNILGRNVGKTSAQMATLETALRKTGISAIQARNNIARMVGAQIDLANATDLARIAQDAAVIANLDSSAAFERLITGISTGQSRVLRTMGLFIDFGAAIDAAADASGRAADSFTELEKTQIRANAVLAGAGQIAGAYESALETAGKQLGSMRRHVSNLMVALGDPAMPTFTEAVFGMSDMIENFSAVVVENKDILTEWADRLADAFVSVFKALILVTGAWAALQIVTWAAAIAPTILALGSLTLGVNSLSGALVILQLALGPVGWFTLALVTITAGVYAWRRAHDGQAEELRDIGKAANEAADGIWALNNAQVAGVLGKLGITPPAGFGGGARGPQTAVTPPVDFDKLIKGLQASLRRIVEPVFGPRHIPSFDPLTEPAAFAPRFGQPSRPPSGFAGQLGPGAQPLGGGMMSTIGSTLTKGMDQLWARMGPPGLAIAALFDIVKSALVPLQPVIDALREPLKIIGTLIGQILAPALKLLVPIVKVLAVALTFVTQAIGHMVQALGWFIDHLVPDFISKVGQGMEQWGKDMVAQSKAAREALGATNGFTDALRAATVNIPRALPLAFLRQQAGMGNLVGTPGSAGGGDPPGRRLGGGGTGVGDEREGGDVFHITVSGVLDPREAAQAVMDEIRRMKGRGQSIELDRHYQLRTT